MQFIQEYQLDPDICDSLIDMFKLAKKQKLVQRGHIGDDSGSSVNKDVKDSWDLYIKNVPNDMLEQYRYIEFMNHLKDCVELYMQNHPILARLGEFGISETPILQHYKPGGGFKIEHFERSGLSSSTRWLVWMMYLNDVKYQGGTHFTYQNFTAQPKKGKLLLWPSDFTHTHKGVVAPSEHKYIITGWLNFI